MFEAHVLHLLRRYLGEYVRGLSVEALKISVWKGDVVLKDLQLKAEALNALKLPITVKAGFLGSVTLKVPWNRLGKEPVIVLLDRIFVLAEPLKEDTSLKREDKESWLEAKRRRVEEKELTYLEAKDKKTATSENAPETSTWLGSLIATIVGNLKISITNLHIRYEDAVSNPGHPFCSGVTLARLAAVTVDETGNETFLASGALERLRKKLELERLAVYHDSNTDPWKLDKQWEDLTPAEWSEIFEAGVSTDVPESASSANWAVGRKYLLHPVEGSLRYHRRGKRENREPHVPFQKLSLTLDQLSVTVSEAQYCDGMKLLEGVSRYRTRMQYSHLRPQVPVSENKQAWWLYACQAVLQQQSKIWYRLSWAQLVDVCEKRRKYVRLYATCLQQGPKVDNEEIKEMDKSLDVEVILLWRLLAHAKVESAKSKEAAIERERVRRSGWWSFGWRGGADGNSQASPPKGPGAETEAPGQLTTEEWNKINDLLSYRPEEESSAQSSPEAPNMLQTEMEVSIVRSGAEVLDQREMQILCGRFEDLQISLLRYPKTEKCDVKLKFYGLSAPEGGLIESVSRAGRDHALTTAFVYCPLDEHLDWKLAATMSPCHVTVWRVSFDRFLHFLKSSQGLSPGVALETAAVLQSKLEEVTRRAQEQLQLVLEEQSRFHVHLDLDAPKIAIPAEASEFEGEGTQLLLDLGHFTLQTSLGQELELEKTGLYSRFHISGSDISAFLVDGPFEWSELPTGTSTTEEDVDSSEPQTDKPSRLILPVLDRCGMSLVLDQIRVQHPSFPATRLQIKVPHLGVHFSPGRYRRLLLVMEALEGADQPLEGDETLIKAENVAAWHPADFAGDARILLWGGIGNTVAEWQPCWAVLAGTYLYILETEFSQSYQRCTSIVGKQVLEVPPQIIGGSENVIVAFHRGVDMQKAVESSNAVLLQLKNEDSHAAWLHHLTRAAYKASVPVSLSLPEFTENESDSTDADSVDLNKQPRLLVIGSLHELQISLLGSSNRAGSTGSNGANSLREETLILQLQATGGKVDVLQRQYDLLIGVKLHSLKIEDRLQGPVGGPSCHYIARSVISSRSFTLDPNENGDLNCSLAIDDAKPEEEEDDDDDDFDDALQDFGRESPDQSPSTSFSHTSSKLGVSTSMDQALPHWGLDPLSAIKAEALLDKIFSQRDEVEVSDFVKMRLAIRHKESIDYNGVDTQINIRMATLDFFCNRITVVALIDFGMEFSDIMDSDTGASVPRPSTDAPVPAENAEATERHIVRGLLGRGKSRVVFQLRMDMESARIYLNKEDGSQLAVLAQERFMMDLKVYPGSFSISSTLGNLRVCDSLLGPDHQWGWLCDIRDPGCGSLVEIEFHSYNKEDDDFQGYDYSLAGKLSAVRIVFLYRFIQEITAYFYALATPQVQQSIMVKDKVGGTEKLVQQSDMEGTPAVKLNVSLDTPIIIMPRNSQSHECMQLDLGHLEVFNTFHWHGGRKSDPSAVHMDLLSAEITDINMVVGINGQPGKPMIEEASGIHITVQRPLRDLFKKVPEMQVDVQVDMLCGVMSDKEYLVILDCASTNVSEPPNLPASFRDSGAASEVSDQEFMHLESPQQDADEPVAPVPGSDGQALTSWTKMRWNVDVRHVELELYVGVDRDSPLARLEIQGFWLNYCTTTTQDMDLYVTLPKVSIVDLRADTKPEMRLMLGSMSDVDVAAGAGAETATAQRADNGARQPEGPASPQLTMLVMDMRMKRDSQAFMIRVQRPRLLVVVDFLLAIGEFFVPSLGAITGRDEAMDVSNDPITERDHIRLQTAYHLQTEEKVMLSEGRQLVADKHDIDEFVYDGGGNSLFLDITEDATCSSRLELEPFIFIGSNKHLRFKNIHIKNGLWLSKAVHLSCDSSYSVSYEDGVVLKGYSDDCDFMDTSPRSGLIGSFSSVSPMRSQKDMSAMNNFVLDVQAVAPELTFYDSTKWPSGTLSQREKLLRAKFSFNLMLATKGKDQWIRGQIKNLSIEGGSGIVVVDPLDVTGEYTCVQDKTSMIIGTTDISMRLSFNVISLVLRFHQDAASTFRFRDAHPVLPCTHFDRIWVTNTGSSPSQQVTIWRPRPPPGYAILSDCATSGTSPPSQAVMAVSKAYRHVQKPVRFDLLWSTAGDMTYQQDGEACRRLSSEDLGNCWCIWVPIAPPGYVALGCVVERGTSPPPLSIVHCIRSDLITSGSMSDCLFYMPPDSKENHKSGCSIWRIENAVGSFYVHSSIEPPPKSVLCDLRELLRYGLDSSGNDTGKKSTESGSPLEFGSSRRLERRPSSARLDSIQRSPSQSSARNFITTPQFERIWWDKGSDSRKVVSIWRPKPPPGYAVIGDCLVEGLEPPSFGVALREDDAGTLMRPTKYLQRMNTSGKGLEDVYIWFPVAPAGYVAMGCIATKTQQMPPLDQVRCIRMDLVTQVNFSKKAVWSMSTEKNVNMVWSIGVSRVNYNCSLWKVENEAHTFIARPDLKRPPARMAYRLVETGKRKLRDNITAEVKIGRLSATVYDDLSGLMTPVVDMTVTNINLAAQGRSEAFSVVVITAIAASTFNVRLEAWEPLIEPFDGIIKFESYDISAEASLRIGKRFRITAANVVNINLSSAALDALVGAALSWRKQGEFEQKARMVLQVEESEGKDAALNSALEEEDLETVVFENSIGNELYLRTFKDNFQKITVVPAEQSNLIHLPPPKFPDKFMTNPDARQIRHYVVVHVSEAKDLLVSDDGNGQDYLCALRVVSRQTDAKKSLPQSARSCCVRPSSLTQGTDTLLATAKWNEVFVFEVSQQGPANLEVVVTNMAAKGGKGQAVGVVSIPMEEHNGRRLARSSLWNVVKQSLLHRSSWPSIHEKTFALRSPRRREGGVEKQKSGSIAVAMFFFTSGPNPMLGREGKSGGFEKKEVDRSDIGLWFSSNSEGPWTGMRSVLTLGTFPRQIGEQNLAVEVSLEQGSKHVKLRSLVTVANNTDMALTVCICPFSRLNTADGGKTASDEPDIALEEMYENQRFQPLGGWGSKWPGHLMPTDPGRWSSRDLSSSSQDFIDTPLPPGWVWTSDWALDKGSHVDGDGWYYGADFQSLKWPPSSTKASRKGVFDFARRRRWVRTRRRVPESTYIRTRHVIGVIEPGASIPVPLSSINAKTDFCVQVRPHTDPVQYTWGRAIGGLTASGSARSNDEGSQSGSQSGSGSGSKAKVTKSGVPISAFLLNELEKTEELLLCLPAPGGKSKGFCWLNMEADASILYTELNTAVYDWKLSVNAPLKLENRLPCKAEYIIWEKPREGNPVRKSQGVVSAGESVFVYFVDLRRPVYLTWLAQGGWKPEKEAVLISDPCVEALPSGFWIIHQQNQRKLRVSLENDFGNTTGSAKIVRLFVPYWLCDDAALPLSYRLVEIEPSGSETGDSSWLNRAAKAAKQAARRPARVGESTKTHLHKVVQSLELLEDSQGGPAMLSLQAQSDRVGGLSLANNTEGGRLSARLGLVVTIGSNTRCSYALSFRDLEENMETVDFRAADGNGAYYKLSAFLDMSSDRTKVVHLQPHTVFINRLGRRIRLRQGDLQHEELLYPNDAARTILWHSFRERELLRICIEGHKWSQPFSVETDGMMQMLLQGEDGNTSVVRTEVRSGIKGSRFVVVFRPASFHSPYRIENRSEVLPFRYRQAGGASDSWQLLGPGSAASFAWEDLQRDRLLEILVDGADPLTARRFCIDDVGDYQPMPTKGAVAALHVRVLKEGLMRVVKVADWKPSDSALPIVLYNPEGSPARAVEPVQPATGSDNQFHAILELAELGISIVDHTPEELLYITMQNLTVQHATGLGSGTSRFKLRVDLLQVDNQLPLTPMPVLFTTQDGGNKPEFLLKLTATMNDQGMADYRSYPYVGIQGPSVPSVAFLVKIHEPIIWRLHEMFSQLNLSRLTSSQTTDVAMDPIIRIGLLHTTEVRFKVTLAMSPTQRPRGMLGFWSTLMTSLGNTDEMPIRINPRVHEEITMRQSALITAAVSSIRNDVLSKPLSLISGVDLLGNASTALGHMSKGVAALSMDKKFIRNRTRQDTKANVEDIGDGLREGGEALAKGLFRGVTGILTKPLEGARSSGMEGFVQGMGKGVIGAASQPISGVLDFLSRTTEGANATRMKLTAAITFEEQLLRKRLPRVIGGDNVLRPYDDYKARGQVLMQLAERGAIFGPIDLFKVRGKFAMSDAYENHFNLPKNRTLMITHRRVILLQHPQGFVVQKKADLLKDPCTVTWDVTWDDFMTMELAHGKEEPQNLPKSRLIIHLRGWSQDTRLFDSKEIARIVKCHSGSKQAEEIRVAIQKAYDTYGPDRATVIQGELQRRPSTRKPYAAAGAGAASGAALGLLAGPAAAIAVPVMATFGALMGTAGEAMLDADSEIPPQQESFRSSRQASLVDQPSFRNSMPESAVQIGRITNEFQLIWMDKGAPWSKKFQVSIWRPVPPAGYVSVGDVVQRSYDPPDSVMVYRDERDGKFMLPDGFDLVWRDTESGAREPVTIWKPRPPAGYVVVGSVAVPEYCEPERALIRCVRRDRAGNVALGQVPLWRDYKGAAIWHCSLWQVQNEAHTFLAKRDHQPPPPNLAFTVL